MKRYIFLVAAVALAAVSCSKTYDVKPVTGEAIGFGAWADNLTRAARVPGTSTFTASGYQDNDFAVYGFKDMDTPAPVTVFDDVTVSSTNGTTWTYSPLRFWDKNYDKYVFYAVSPAAIGTGGTVDPQTGEITSASIAFAGNDNDILVADKETVANASYGTTVELDFNHAASLVDFKVNKAPNLTNATVTVTAFTLGNIQTTGVMTVSSAYNATVYGGTNGPVVTWSNTATGTYTTTNGVNSVSLPQAVAEDTAFDPETPTDPADATFIINNLVVKPQTFTAPSDRANPADASNAAAQKLTITYTIAVTNGGTNTYTSTLWLSDFDIVNDDSAVPNAQTKVGSWDTGKHYTFYITLDSIPIVFGARINDWVTGTTGYHYLVN